MPTRRVLQLTAPFFPSGTTRVAGVIGDPVRHSLSPVLHNAAFRATGLDWLYVAFPVSAGGGAGAMGAMRTLGIEGLSVTMPHKAEVVAALDQLSPTAERLHAVNTVVRQHGALVGHSTDGQGFVDALRAGAHGDPAGRRALVLGTGGAARAVCLALAQCGVTDLGVVGRRRDAVEATVALCDGRGRAASIGEVGDVDLVVNATPVGMGSPAEVEVEGGGSGSAMRSLPFDLDPRRLGPGQTVVDLIYHPLVTPLMLASQARGATASNGLGMLVHQAALQFTLWTGVSAPLEAMVAAATAATAPTHQAPAG